MSKTISVVRRTKRPPSFLTPAVLGFSVASFFSDWGHEMVTALLPGFLTGLGAPPLAMGVVEGVSNLAQALAGLWAGTAADRSARRPAIAIGGYLATALKAAMAVIFWWPWIVLVRTAAWIGRGARGPIRDKLIAEEVPAPYRGRAYGFREAWDTAGAILGAVAAATLVSRIPIRPLMAWSAVPGLAAVAAVALLVHDRRPRKVIGTPPALPAESPALRRAVWALSQFQVGWVAPTLLILRVEKALPSHGIVLATGLYVLHNLAYAATAFPAGSLADKWGPGRVLLITGTLAAVTLAGFALPGTSLPRWAVLFSAAGVATAFWETAQKPWILRRAEEQAQGRGFGRTQASLGVAQLVGNLVVAAIWTVAGASLAFLLAAAAAAQGTFRIWLADHAIGARGH
jgi:MFS family permease